MNRQRSCSCPEDIARVLGPPDSGTVQLVLAAVDLADGNHGRWHSGPYCVPGAPCGYRVRNGFTHMIRAPGDPERRSRKQRHADMGIEAATTEVMRSRKTRKAAEAVEQVAALLSDGEPRTLNRIGVELWDQTADVVSDEIWFAIVDAVEQGRFEHCTRSPVLLRLRAP